VLVISWFCINCWSYSMSNEFRQLDY